MTIHDYIKIFETLVKDDNFVTICKEETEKQNYSGFEWEREKDDLLTYMADKTIKNLFWQH